MSRPSSSAVPSRLRVVRPFGYPARFNTPRVSRHDIVTRRWLPTHKVWKPSEVCLLMPVQGADLVASFNRIPLGHKPFVISFESHLPRMFGYEDSRAFRFFTSQLATDRCRAIVPISDYARRRFLKQQAASPHLATLEAKLSDVIYPSVNVAAAPAEGSPDDAPLRAVFVGSHFARKGGIAILQAAEHCARAGIPIEFHIVSDLVMGRENGVWTDPPKASFFDEAMKLMALPNVRHHGKLPNAEVIALLQASDVSLLPTLSDTFGYSVLEAFALGLPVIGTDCCALPELIRDGHNGRLLSLETNADGVWAPLAAIPSHEPRYQTRLTDTMQDLGQQLFQALAAMEADRAMLGRMRAAAYADATERFEAARQGAVLDALYERALERSPASGTQ